MTIKGTTPDVPNITGFPVLDTLLKYGIAILGTAVAAWTMSWLSAHGYQSKYFTGETISTVVVGATVAIAMAVWAAMSKYRTIVAFIEKILEAAGTGQIDSQVAKLATTAQASQIRQINAVPNRQANAVSGRPNIG